MKLQRSLPAVALLTWSACAAPGWAVEARRPFVAYAWSKSGTFDNIVPFYWIKASALDPANAKAAADGMPEGHRVLFSWDVHRPMTDEREDYCRAGNGTLTDQPGIWWDKGAEKVARKFDSFFAQYKALGGKVNAFVLDQEAGLSNWHLGNKHDRWLAIQNDPRFPEIAKQLGFTDLLTVCDWSKQKGQARENQLKWNALQQKRVAAYVNRSVSTFPRSACQIMAIATTRSSTHALTVTDGRTQNAAMAPTLGRPNRPPCTAPSASCATASSTASAPMVRRLLPRCAFRSTGCGAWAGHRPCPSNLGSRTSSSKKVSSRTTCTKNSCSMLACRGQKFSSIGTRPGDKDPEPGRILRRKAGRPRQRVPSPTGRGRGCR